MVSCSESDVERDRAKGTNSTTIQHPRLIAEVLSPDSTAVYDEREKRELYQRCPTLEVYLLLDQDKPHVSVYRRATGWQLEQYTGQQTMSFPEFGLSITLPDLYAEILALMDEIRRKRKEDQR